MTRRDRLLIAALLIPILIDAYAGRFSRLMADDFCYAVNTRTYGFPAVIGYYYDNWFGRLTQTVGAAVGTSLGVGFAEVFPAILIALWLIGLLCACRELAGLLHVESRAAAPIAAVLILYATLAGTPQIFHSLYWISAVFPYTVPLVLATFDAALVLRALRLNHAPPGSILACVVLTLAATFASEPFAVAFVAALAAGIVGGIVLRSPARRAALTLLIPMGVTALIALAIMVAAPGNTLRQGLFVGTHAPIPLAGQSFMYAGASLIVLIWTSPPAVLLALILPAVIAYGQPPTPLAKRALRLGIGLALLIAFGLLVLINVPAIYATSTNLPARALIIPQFVLICACAAVGWLIGLDARKSARRSSPLIAAGLIGLLLIVGPLLTAGQMIALTPKLSTYASEWDQRDQQLRADASAGQETVQVAPLSVDVASLTGLDTISADATSFTNTCAAGYYGLQSLTAAG